MFKRHRVSNIAPETLRSVLGIRNFETLTSLELAGNNLSKLKGLSTLTQLKKLYVSFNELVKLDDIAGMVRTCNTNVYNCTL